MNKEDDFKPKFASVPVQSVDSKRKQALKKGKVKDPFVSFSNSGCDVWLQ